MKSARQGQLARLWRAEAFSPKDFFRRAAFLAVVYWAAELAGLREFTSFLSGTAPHMAVGEGVAAFLGCLYMLLYFAWVLLVPILLIAAAIGCVWYRWSARGRA